jgi:hypothetical protein
VKTIQLRTLNGIRNDVSPERFDRDANGRSTGFTDLSVSVNMDLDETGKLIRRLGTLRLAAGAAHSLFSAGDYGYVVMNGVLNHVAPNLALTPVCSVAQRTAMAQILNAVYWSDTQSVGMLRGAVNAPWGIVPPPAFDAITTLGDLLAGTYLYTMTYVRSTGEESGAPSSGSITLAVTGGIRFTALPVSIDPLAATKRLYLSERGGDLPLLAGELPNTTTAASIAAMPALDFPVRTQFMGPPPAGQVVGYFAGRSLIASGSYLWYSQPHEYGLFDLQSGYTGFDSGIRTVAPVTDGVFIGTTNKHYWLGGTDPAKWELAQRAPYGSVLGTEVMLANYQVGQEGVPGVAMGWMSTKGFCIGLDGGQMQNVTGGRHVPPSAREGASLLKFRGATPQVVTTLFN